MYVRYTAKFFDREKHREETGIFRAADYVRDYSGIGAGEKENLQKLIDWFDTHLPVPQFYDDPAKRTAEQHTYFWFKTSAEEILEQMEALCAILEAYGVRVETICAETPAGEKVFEDFCQIAVVPAGDVLRVK